MKFITSPPSFRGRIPRDCAQGVRGWTRWLGGREWLFLLVVDGWWGVGDTGTVTVYRSGYWPGDWYPCKTFHVTVQPWMNDIRPAPMSR